MNRKLILSFVLSLGLSACNRPAPVKADTTPTIEVAGGVEMIDFDDEKGTYTCRAPRLWGIDEDGAETFVGPRDPKTQGSSFITIIRFPGDSKQWSDPQKYAESFWEIDPQHKQPAIEKREIGGLTVLFLHQEQPFYKLHSHKVEYMLRNDYALIPAKGGFFAIEHRAPASAYKTTLPVFEAVVKSFKPKI